MTVVKNILNKFIRPATKTEKIRREAYKQGFEDGLKFQLKITKLMPVLKLIGFVSVWLIFNQLTGGDASNLIEFKTLVDTLKMIL